MPTTFQACHNNPTYSVSEPLQAGLGSLEEYTEMAEKGSQNVVDAVKIHLLSNHPEKGLNVGLRVVKGKSIQIIKCHFSYIRAEIIETFNCSDYRLCIPVGAY